jgi:hypothetical protein
MWSAFLPIRFTPRGKSSLVPVERGLSGPHSHLDVLEAENNLTSAGIQIPDSSTCRLVLLTTQFAPSWNLYFWIQCIAAAIKFCGYHI